MCGQYINESSSSPSFTVLLQISRSTSRVLASNSISGVKLIRLGLTIYLTFAHLLLEQMATNTLTPYAVGDIDLLVHLRLSFCSTLSS